LVAQGSSIGICQHQVTNDILSNDPLLLMELGAQAKAIVMISQVIQAEFRDAAVSTDIWFGWNLHLVFACLLCNCDAVCCCRQDDGQPGQGDDSAAEQGEFDLGSNEEDSDEDGEGHFSVRTGR